MAMKFASVGMCEAAVKGYLKVSMVIGNTRLITAVCIKQCNQIKAAMECCIELNQVS